MKKMTRDEKIVYYFLKYLNYSEIARKVGCSRRTVTRVLYGE
jgi:DNA-directed RNA polymerase specialized sigma24 family protein